MLTHHGRENHMNHTSAISFTGNYLDSVVEGYPLGSGYRWYLPPLMRFNTADDLSPFSTGGPNPYAYCEGDPINFDDPTGHMMSPPDPEVLEEVPHEVAALGAPTSSATADVPIATHRAAQGTYPDEAQPSTSAGPYPAHLQLQRTRSIQVGFQARASRFLHQLPDYYHILETGKKMDEITGKLDRNIARNMDLNYQEPNIMGKSIQKVFDKKEKIRVLLGKLDSYIKSNRTDRETKNWEFFSSEYKTLMVNFDKHDRSVNSMMASIQNLLRARFTLRRTNDTEPPL